MKKLLTVLLFLPLMAFAALYNIVGTDDYVNGVPPSLTKPERAKLVTVTIAKTDTAIIAGKYNAVDRVSAKAKIKAIIKAETPPPVVVPPPVCPQYTTGTYPACVPIPCGTGFTGNEPNCVAIPPPVCPSGTVGTPPNCVTPPPSVCAEGFTGTPPNCIPIPPPPVSYLPAVDISKNMTPAKGSSVLVIKATTEKPSPNNKNWGEFRVDCITSHMSNNDPMVYPNQEGASHHHTFFGNVGVTYNTDLSKLPDVGNSTCNGGIMNRSAYWIPSMIDTVTNAPIQPSSNVVYYKSDGYSDKVVDLPKGLRMIAGNAKATTEQSGITRYTCNEDYNTHQTHIPACKQGETLETLLYFPSCWDGVNLDSPNHKDHMAYPTGGPLGSTCPANFPVHIPVVTYNIHYNVTTAGGTANWRLASDNYAPTTNNRGFSLHGDYVYGWTQDATTGKPFIDGIVKNCLQAKVDCHAHLLGDGRMFNSGKW